MDLARFSLVCCKETCQSVCVDAVCSTSPYKHCTYRTSSPWSHLEPGAELLLDGVLVVLLDAQLLLDDLELLAQDVLPVLLLHLVLHLHPSTHYITDTGVLV